MKHFHAMMRMAYAGVLLISFSGALFAEAEITQTSEAAKGGGVNIVEKDMAVIEFPSGKSVMSDTEKTNLQTLSSTVYKDSTLKEIVVAAWSDHEYPEEKGPKLTSADRKLADDRAAAVRVSLIKDGIPASKISTHSMAVHPGWLAKTFRTEDAKLKGTVKSKGMDSDIIASIGKQLRTKGGPGKVVIVAMRTPAPPAH